MARDVRQLRAEAQDASNAGKHKKALAAYLELEQLEPRDAQWSKRAAETYRRLGKDKDAIGAFARAADRYASGGFLVQAIAVCKLILSIDPKNDDALRRIASMNEQIGAGPTRAIAMAESNPNLADNAAVTALRSGSGSHPALRDNGSGSQQALRDAGSGAQQALRASQVARMDPAPVADEPAPPIAIPRTRTPSSPVVSRTRSPQGPRELAAVGQAPVFPDPSGHDERTRAGSTPPPIAIARTKSKPISLPPDMAIESISLRHEVEGAIEDKERSGVYEIPIDDQPLDLVEIEAEGSGDYEQSQDYAQYGEPYEGGDIAPNRESLPMIEIEEPEAELAVETEEPLPELDAELESVDELAMDDIEEIPLAEPRMMGAAAADALARTPLFAGLSREALESLVQQLTLVHLGVDEILFQEGDPGDALYVIVEGEVAVQAEGPPRVEMARLGPGAFIGEVALMTDQPRSATVTATEDSELLRIDRKTLSGVLAEHGEILAAVLRFVRHRLVDRWTRTSPLFRPFDDSVRDEIASRFKFLEVAAGTKLLDAGKKPDALYIVLAGRFSVLRGGAHVATIGPGELIGETALLSGTVFKSEVIAQGKSLALGLPASDFRELIMTHPHMLEYIGEAAEQSRKLEIL